MHWFRNGGLRLGFHMYKTTSFLCSFFYSSRYQLPLIHHEPFYSASLYPFPVWEASSTSSTHADYTCLKQSKESQLLLYAQCVTAEVSGWMFSWWSSLLHLGCKQYSQAIIINLVILISLSFFEKTIFPDFSFVCSIWQFLWWFMQHVRTSSMK